MVARQSKIFAGFRDWLKAGGYSDSAINQYSVAVRLALGLLNKPYLEIDLDTDFWLYQLEDAISEFHPETQAT